MFRKFIFILSVLCSQQNIYAMGPACFNYETYEHQGPLAGLNNALLNYDHAQIAAGNNAIPPLAPAALQLQVSLLNTLVGGPWVHNIFPLGAGLTYQEACMMALEREGLGIRIRFRHPRIIRAVALGQNLGGFMAGLGGFAGFMAYLDRALGGGGYRPTVLAAALFRLRYNVPRPNFVALPVGFANTVLIHIHNQVRVSKNAKELSYNSVILNNPAYMSLKEMIDVTYNVIGLAPPHSASVLSSDNLQLN